jgi:hypothetical protein
LRRRLADRVWHFAAFGAQLPAGWLSDPDYALYSLGWIISWQMLGSSARA